MKAFYSGRRVLVTGGLGFIGSNLAIRLAGLGAEVVVVDARVPGCGGNPFNLLDQSKTIRIVERDIGDPAIRKLLDSSPVVFNLAGEVSHVHSMLYPERDLCINTTAHLRFLSACAEHQSRLRVVYASTRQVYGIPQALPVDENHPVCPVDFNGIHKHAAEQQHLLLTRLGRMDAMVLRLTNIYGPRMAIGLPCQGFLPVFAHRAIRKERITVFGDGLQMRDPVYVDDACDAFVRAGMVQNPERRTLNIGSSQPLTVGAIAEEFARQGDLPEPELRPFPADRKPIDIGSYIACTEACYEQLGWRATTSFRDGVRRTLRYYGDPGQVATQAPAACPLGHIPAAARA
ncbi:MAG: NAD-dependent epimerase/dehydratase family protein [Bryobacteraceae bacterium]